MLKLRLPCLALLIIASLLVGAGGASAAVIFKDTDNHWAKTTIEWGVEKGIVKGYANGTFMPNQNVTEAEFIRMLVVGVTGKDLEDTYLTDRWSDKYYNLLHFKNYPLMGYADLNLRNSYITRTQVAEIIASADGVNYTGDQAIQYVMGKKYALGRIKGEQSIKSYMGHITITRAEVLQVIKNLVDHGMVELFDRPETTTSEAKLPKMPTAWDMYRDEMYLAIRKKVFSNYTGYRIYDDGDSKIVMTKIVQSGQIDNAVSVQFEQQIKAFSGVTVTDITDKTQRKMLADILNLYGFLADDAFMKQVDSAEKTKKEVEVKVGGKTLVIDPQITSPTNNVLIYHKWWNDSRS